MKNIRLFRICLVLTLWQWALHAWCQTPAHFSVYYEQALAGQSQKSVVIALSGVKLRTTPSFEGKVLAVIPFKETVLRKHPIFNLGEALGVPYNPPVWTPDSIPGHWEEVEWKGKTGYAFDAFLGQGIHKMTEDFYLLFEDFAACWSDTYASPDYYYYGIFINADSSVCTLRQAKPTFYVEHDEFGPAPVRLDDKQRSAFLIASRMPLAEEGPLKSSKIDLPVMQVDPKDWQHVTWNAVSLPGSDWVVEGGSAQAADGSKDSAVWLRDKKTGRKQNLLEQEDYSEGIYVVWCGDLDRDGTMDFMLVHGEEKGGAVWSLFLSRNAGKGRLVRPAIVYRAEDCC